MNILGNKSETVLIIIEVLFLSESVIVRKNATRIFLRSSWTAI